jgi:hypothetical protein
VLDCLQQHTSHPSAKPGFERERECNTSSKSSSMPFPFCIERPQLPPALGAPWIPPRRRGWRRRPASTEDPATAGPTSPRRGRRWQGRGRRGGEEDAAGSSVAANRSRNDGRRPRGRAPAARASPAPPRRRRQRRLQESTRLSLARRSVGAPGRRARGGAEGARPRRRIEGAGQAAARPRYCPPLTELHRCRPQGGRQRSLGRAGRGAPPRPYFGDVLLLLLLRSSAGSSAGSGDPTAGLRVRERRAPSGVEEAAGVEQSVREPRGERRSGWAADPPGMRERGRLASFCSSRCGDCWSRYSGSSICKTRLQHGLQKLLETVLDCLRKPLLSASVKTASAEGETRDLCCKRTCVPVVLRTACCIP